jgi:hypothetical protein
VVRGLRGKQGSGCRTPHTSLASPLPTPSSPASPPHSFFFEALRRRLAQPDCVARGWLLDGFPHTAEQCAQLAEEGIVPDKVRGAREGRAHVCTLHARTHAHDASPHDITHRHHTSTSHIDITHRHTTHRHTRSQTEVIAEPSLLLWV